VKVHLKLPERLLDEITARLRQPHPVAFERVGFVACAGGNTSDGVVLLARSFHPVRDGDYEADELVGARISSRAVQSVLALAYAKAQSMLFVHEHGHKGIPHPSRVDLDCWRELIPNFRAAHPSYQSVRAAMMKTSSEICRERDESDRRRSTKTGVRTIRRRVSWFGRLSCSSSFGME